MERIFAADCDAGRNALQIKELGNRHRRFMGKDLCSRCSKAPTHLWQLARAIRIPCASIFLVVTSDGARATTSGRSRW